MTKTHTLALLCALCASVVQPALGQDKHADFARLHKELTAAKEPWQTIPWHLSILDARAQATKENKPIYMLCRSGHPLACV